MPDYYYSYDYITPDTFVNGIGQGLAVFLGVSIGFIYIFAILFSLITVVALWFIFEKARENGWASLIPFYNQFVMYKITWGNGWFFLLLFIPITNIVIHIITQVKLAKAFGKGGGWACGLIFLHPIFLCIMAFDKNMVYVGDYAGNAGTSQNSGSSETYYSYYKTDENHAPHEHPNYCPACGSPVNAEDKFCLKCGQRL